MGRNENLFLITTNWTVTGREMNKRKHHHLQSVSSPDRKRAEQMCERKLKRLSSSTLYKKVLVRNTLKFVQASQKGDVLFHRDEDEDLLDHVNEILNEMIFPQSFLPLPEDLSFDWPQPPAPHHMEVAFVPDVEIIEDEPDQEFLNTIFSDRTNVTITRLAEPRHRSEKDSRDHYKTQSSGSYSRPSSIEIKKIKPEITLIPSSSLKILINDL